LKEHVDFFAELAKLADEFSSDELLEEELPDMSRAKEGLRA